MNPLDGPSEQELTYAAFQELDEGEWTEWLALFLAGTPNPPFIHSSNEAWHQILIRLFDGLGPKASGAFNRALFKQFEATTVIRKNELQLYTLLHVISYTLPGEAKQLLRRRLREGVFRSLNFHEQNLNNLLLAACSKFHVDDELAKWIQNSARSSKNFDYLLLCQWVLSTVEDDQSIRFIEKLLPVMTGPEEAARATRQLGTIAERLGYRRLLEWYGASSTGLQRKWGQRWGMFVNTLRERLLSDWAIGQLALIDPDAVLFYVELRLSKNQIPLNTVLEVARLHKYVDSGVASSLLINIWTDLWERSGESPWQFMTASEIRGAVASNESVIFRKVGVSFLKAGFQADQEPETERVLIEARNACDLMLSPQVRTAGSGR